MSSYRLELLALFLIFSTSLANFAPKTEKWENNFNQLFHEREIPTMTVVSLYGLF